jgi:hypothetical protein
MERAQVGYGIETLTAQATTFLSIELSVDLLITMRPGEPAREISVLPEGLSPHAALPEENAAEFRQL